MAFLDWSTHRNGPLQPCRICRAPALMRDEHGEPCHKACAEAVADTQVPPDMPEVPADLLTLGVSNMELRPDPETLLRNALTAAERGWHVFPVAVNAKHPAFPDHDAERCTGRDPRCARAGGHVGWEPRATVDTDRISRAWSRTPYNVGIACGPSALTVVDLDVPKPGQEPPAAFVGDRHGAAVLHHVAAEARQPYPDGTHTVMTGRGGQHLYFTHPADGPALRNSAGKLGWLIDTRAHGGYVLGAGSIVAGRPYKTAADADPAPLPEWLAERLRPAPLPERRLVVVELAPDRRGRYLTTAVERECERVARAGTARNRELYAAAVALGQLVAGGELPADYVERELTRAAEACGLHTDPPPGQVLRTIASGLRAGQRRPRSVVA
ncbi:bifunctional DNA primase/polymerase [Dactylosporangium sp. NPDC051541]|uniref:bifunctional DNA primase/polymerase n=1 Tax=Dactylosporangium sp. NPDC051541 TaxID=3363977 RepID=UPI0037B663E8